MPGVWGVLEAPRALGCWVCGRPGALARPLTGPRASNRPPQARHPKAHRASGLRDPRWITLISAKREGRGKQSGLGWGVAFRHDV